MNFYTEGITGFVSVNDVVKIMMGLMKSNIKNERYILVAKNVSFKYVLSQIALNFNKKKPSIKVSKILSEIGWRLDKIKSVLTNKPPILTKQSAKSIHNNYYFSSEKIKKALDFEFEPIANSIKKVCEFYKKDL